MKLTTLWFAGSIGTMLLAVSAPQSACGGTWLSPTLLTTAVVGQTEAQTALSKKDVDALLKQAREQLEAGKLDAAEEILRRAEKSGVKYNLFLPGDKPSKVRADLDKARQQAARATSKDPFNNRTPSRGSEGALVAPNRYPVTPPHQVSMPIPPEVTTSGTPGVIAALPGMPDSKPALRTSSDLQVKQARLALAVGDFRKAKQHLLLAKEMAAPYLPQEDSPAKVEADLVKYEQHMSEQATLGNNPAWRQQHGRILCEQAIALIQHGALDDAERLAGDAQKLGVQFGAYELSPQNVMKRIVEAKRGNGQNNMVAVTATPGAGAAGKDQVLGLLSAARAALAVGQLKQAEEFAAKANQLNVPSNAFAEGEDTPALLALEIHKARMNRAQTQVAQAGQGEGVVTAGGTTNVGGNAENPLYDPGNDATTTIQATSESPLAFPRLAQRVPTPAPLPVTDAEPVEEGSGPAQLLSAGETALQAGDTAAALKMFQEAYAKRSELDPVAQQRLQSHLQMLSVNGSSGAVSSSPADTDLIDAASRSEQVAMRKLSADITRLQAEARRVRESNPKQALELLSNAQGVLKESTVSQDFKTQLSRRVELSVQETENYIERNRAQLELDEQNREVLAEVDRRRQLKLDKQQRIADLVEQFNNLQDEQRFDEMEVVAARLYELAPEEEVAQMAWQTAKTYRRMKLNDALQNDKESAVWATFHSTEESAVPFDDSNPFQHGDPHAWGELSRTRREAARRGQNRLNEQELEIQRKLKTPVQVNFVDRPLADVVQELARVAGINIYLDEFGLGQNGVTPTQPVSLTLQKEISLKSALDLLLEPLGLDYVIKSEVLKITSEHRSQGEIYPVVYNVADLVVAIPNFSPSAQMGLQSMINDAHAAAAGAARGGFGGPSVFVQDQSPVGIGALDGNVLGQQMGSGIPGLPGGGGAMMPIGNTGPSSMGGSAADFESLIELITTTVAATTWDEVGGPGSIKEFATNLSLVISQTQEVHEEIADLLEQLRRLQDLQVTIEVRFITLSDQFFEQIGVDFDFLIEDGPGVIEQLRPNGDTGVPAPGQRVEGRHRSATVGLLPSGPGDPFPNFTADLDLPFTQDSLQLASPAFGSPSQVAQFGFAILSDLEAYFIIQAAQGDRRSNVLEAPKVTLFNGQLAFVADTVNQPFVTSVIPVVGDFAAAQQPVIVVLSEGTTLSIQAVVSDDRRYVRLTVVPFFTQIGDVEEFTFEGSTTTSMGSSATDDDDDGNDEENSGESLEIRTGTTVQLPTFEIITVGTTVSVPDGGTVLLGGIKRLSEGRNEFGVPLLSKIPYVNRLFRNVAIGRETQSLMLMVTPRIIIQEEEEARLLGTEP